MTTSAVDYGSIFQPIRKFSMFKRGVVEYQCVKTCYPNIPSQPELVEEICNKICPFNRKATDLCSKCPTMIDNLNPKNRSTLDPVVVESPPEKIVDEPEVADLIIHKKVTIKEKFKNCCHHNKCKIIPIELKCEPVCYEPCNLECTGRCAVNPECPNQCKEVAYEKMRIKYQIWLAQKLKEIQLKYRRQAEACLLKTRMTYEGEIKRYVEQAEMIIGNPEIEVVRETKKWKKSM